MTNDGTNEDHPFRLSDPGSALRQLQCPKCDAPMSRVTFNQIEIDRCEGCQGLWFDMLELDKLKDANGAEVLDIGDPAVGSELNKKDTIDCPVCHTRMIRMVDANQPHIWYEQCASCHGVFLDAGEFSDIKTRAWFDIVRGWFAKPRA